MDLIKKAIIDYITSLKYLRGGTLWVFLILPIFISVILGTLFFYLAYLSGAYIAHFLSDLYPFEFGKRAAHTFFHLMPFTYIIAIMVLKYFIYIAISPFMFKVSRKIASQHLLGQKDVITGNNNYSLKRILKLSFRSFYKEILWTILFIGVGIVVPVAGIAGFIITQSYYTGVLHLDYRLSSKLSFREMLTWIKMNRGLALGNGFVYITLMISIFGLILAPVLASAAAAISVSDEDKVEEGE